MDMGDLFVGEAQDAVCECVMQGNTPPQFMQVHASDELLKIYRREYKRRFAWIRAGKITPEAFSDWSETARRMKAKCDAGELAEEDFLRWLGR